MRGVQRHRFQGRVLSATFIGAVFTLLAQLGLIEIDPATGRPVMTGGPMPGGMPVPGAVPAPGRRNYGLQFMRERAELIGAGLDVRSWPDGGTVVRLAIPSPG